MSEPLPTPDPEDDHLRVRLAAFVKAPESDQEFLQDCVDTARDLIDAATGDAEVPVDVYDRAALEVAADLYHRRQTRLGVAGFADNDLNPIRITRDPLAAARGFLAPYLKGPFA